MSKLSKHTLLIMHIKSANSLVVGGVIGEVLDPFTNSMFLRIVYDNNKEVINCGELKPFQIVNPSRIQVGGNDVRTL
jgi:protein FLOWERING LOCUS T